MADTRTYVQPAESLLRDLTYSLKAPDNNWYPTALRTPGISLILAALLLVFRTTAHAYSAFTFLQAIVTPLLPCCAYVLANGVGRRTAIMAYVFVLLLPNLYACSATVLSDTFFAAIMCAVVVLLYRVCVAEEILRHYSRSRVIAIVVIGTMIGVAALIRPVGKYYPLVAAALVVSTARPGQLKRAVAEGAICIGAALLVIAPWLARNWIAFGSPITDTIQGPAMLWSMAPLVRVTGRESDAELAAAKQYVQTNAANANHFVEVHGKLEAYTQPLSASRLLMRVAWDTYAENPLGVFKIWWNNFVQIQTSQAQVDWLNSTLRQSSAFQQVKRWLPVTAQDSFERKTDHFFLELQRALRIVYTWLVWPGLLALFLRNRRLGVFCLVNIVYFAGLTALVSGYDRFRLVLEPIYAVAIAGLFSSVVYAARHLASRRRAAV